MANTFSIPNRVYPSIEIVPKYNVFHVHGKNKRGQLGQLFGIAGTEADAVSAKSVYEAGLDATEMARYFLSPREILQAARDWSAQQRAESEPAHQHPTNQRSEPRKHTCGIA